MRIVIPAPQLFILSACLLVPSISMHAQPAATPAPSPNPNSRRANQPNSVETANFERLRSIEMMVPKERTRTHPLLDPKTGIYRRPGKDEIATLAVSESLMLRFAQFLKGENTGIVKLSAEASCISDGDVVVATENCIPFKMPGAGTSYSFRTESYRLPRLADLILANGVFKTGGVFQQVVMADLGDVAIEDVTLDTRGMKHLLDLKPANDVEELVQFDTKNTKGMYSDGFLYRRGHRMKENSTFALRSIAYRGNYIRSIDGVAYDELEFDKRRDVIVAFRVVDKDESGNVTILWKRLKDVEAPKLKVKK